MKLSEIVLILLITFSMTSFSQEIKWEKTYELPHGFGLYTIFDLTKSNDGNFYVFYSYSDTMELRIIPAIMKISPTGEILWSFYQVNEKTVYPMFIRENKEGLDLYGIWVQLRNMDFESGYRPYKFELDNGGNFIKDKFDSSAKNDLFVNHKGTLILSKDSLLLYFNSYKNNIYMREFDKNVRFLKETAFDTTEGISIPTKAYENKYGNIYLFGTYSYGKSKNFIMKLDDKYDPLWTVIDTTEPLLDRVSLYSVDFYDDGSFTLLGKIFPPYISDSANIRYYIKQYGKDGGLIFNRQYKHARNINVNDITRNTNNELVISGFVKDDESGSYLFHLIKTDSTGQKIWEKTWGENYLNNALSDCITDENDNIYAVGLKEGLMYMACLEDKPVGVADDRCINTGKRVKTQIFPNPAKDKIDIMIDNPVSNKLGISLYDNSGCLISVLFDKEIPSGKYNLEIYLPDVSQGCYYLLIRNGDEIKSKKIIIE